MADHPAPEAGEPVATAVGEPVATGERAEPPDHEPAPVRRARFSRRTVAVGVVAALAGALFATNATLFRGAEERHPQNLVELVAVESARLEGAAEEVDALRTEVDALLDLTTDRIDPPETPPEVAFAAGRVAVEGPGVVVGLWDAPAANAPPGARPDDLLVHQQDVEAVMNALWTGGAEAMTIQGERVTSQTAVRCVGNVLLLHGRTYSPPYEIAAIGDPEALAEALEESEGVQIYLQYVAAVRLGWSLTEERSIPMPAAEITGPPRYASVMLDGAVLLGAGPGPGPATADDGARSGSV